MITVPAMVRATTFQEPRDHPREDGLTLAGELSHELQKGADAGMLLLTEAVEAEAQGQGPDTGQVQGGRTEGAAQQILGPRIPSTSSTCRMSMEKVKHCLTFMSHQLHAMASVSPLCRHSFEDLPSAAHKSLECSNESQVHFPEYKCGHTGRAHTL